jgi:imidazoleglycerol phosphate dehydratase HisB
MRLVMYCDVRVNFQEKHLSHFSLEMRGEFILSFSYEKGIMTAVNVTEDQV